jgi:hypothetical protein
MESYKQKKKLFCNIYKTFDIKNRVHETQNQNDNTRKKDKEIKKTKYKMKEH